MRRIAPAALVALYLSLAGVRAWDRTHPYYDDVGFLDLANQAREIGGPIGLAGALYSGRWTEDNRNPLYVGVLSLVAGRDHGFHTRGRILTIFIGLLAMLAWWRLARRHVGERGALILLAFLSVSECFIDYSGRESAEPLLLLLWALAIGAILDGHWIRAGFYAGLAQLDKGSGIFLVFCTGVALLLWRGWPALRDWRAWGMGVAFIAAASPLLVRNARVYGSPLHHWNNRLVWIDRLPDYAETYAPHSLERLPNGFREWAAQTSWHEIWFGRGVMGVAETAVHLGDSMSFVAPRPFGPVHIPGVVLGFALMMVALRLLYRSPPSFARTFLLVQSALFIAFFFFFSVAGGSSRYVFPMTLCLYAVLARALASDSQWLERWTAVAAICVVLALALDPSTRQLPAGYAETGAWLETHLKPGENYAVDSRSHFEPEWFLPAANHMEIISPYWQRKLLPRDDVLYWMRERGVRYAIVDRASNSNGQPRWFELDEPVVF
ncbi:MAG TPA: glycosyltransferase family 39 protein, partial [Myxococcales bacterium]|nr:glycosyltransferase family 39 protein [Myxococcales bacterium]